MQTRGEILEAKMTTVFLKLQEAGKLTEDKIDLEFLLSIVGSYITAKQQGKLAEEYKTPAEIFDERIFPIVDDSTLEVEEILEDE